MTEETKKSKPEKEQPPVDVEALFAKMQEQNIAVMEAQNSALGLLIDRVQDQTAVAIKDAVEASEIRLGQGFTTGINELKQTMGKAMIEEIINQIQTVQTSLAQQGKAVAEAVVEQKMAQIVGGGGNGQAPPGAPAGGGSGTGMLGGLIKELGGPQGAVDLYNAIKAPSTDQQVQTRMFDWMRGFASGSKVKTEGLTPETFDAMLHEFSGKETDKTK